MRWRSRSPAETRAAARSLAREVGPSGAVIALRGALGAGKTVFAKGLAEGLGLPSELLASPTFTIAHELDAPGGLRLVHADLFRVESAVELEDAGWLDWLVPGTLLAVEWADRWPAELPADRLEIELRREPGGEGGERELEARALGPIAAALLGRWQARRDAAGAEAR
jgi:tRNA threonylcarbamoyladenosine biosynthesis protein TsaE